MVVVIAGGSVTSMEAYSPDGGCSLSMGTVPQAQFAPLLGLLNGKLTYCGNYPDYRYQNMPAEIFIFIKFTKMSTKMLFFL
jgi:hypothetical protein